MEVTTQLEECTLVVDSKPARRETLLAMLRRHSQSVRQADSIAAALETFEAAPCSLVIVAFKLRDGNGLDLLQALRSRAPDVAVILTGRASRENLLAAVRARASDYLPTPLHQEDLDTALAKVARAAQEKRAAHTPDQDTLAKLAQAACLTMLSHLAASLAHEINNPLTPIFGMVELLLEDLPPNHPGRGYSEVIGDSARRIRDVVRSLHDFIEPSAQQPTLLDLRSILTDTLLLAQQQLRGQSISTALSLPDDPVIVMGSPPRLKRALLLLLDNAREAMPQGGRLTIDLSTDQPPSNKPPTGTTRGRVTIAIGDTGSGSQQQSEHLFDQFSLTNHITATGERLGPMLVNIIIQQHGGEVQIEADEQQGAVFRIVLPLAGEASG